MRAVSRLGELLLAGALVLAPAAGVAQEAPAPGNTTAPDSVGPRELENFSLRGTVTRPADQPAAQQPAPQRRQAQGQSQAAPPGSQPRSTTAQTRTPAPSPRATTAPERTETAVAAVERRSEPNGQRAAEPLRQSTAASSVTVALPKLDGSAAQTSASATPAAAASFPPAPEAGTLAPERSLPIWPWLLAALALGAGGAFLFWRHRGAGREAFAGGPQIDAFAAPPPAPAPVPRAAPAAPPAAAPPAPSSLGIVSTRLRPWIDIGFRPVRCVLEDERVTIDFEIELFNSGSAPARGVLIEASIFNAGPAQEGDISRFFENPVGTGERIVAIPPLKRVGVRTQVSAPRSQIQAYELGGRQVFVPLIAFNALYGWSGGEGQTSVSYLVGRDTKSEKLGPFRMDLGPRIFRGLAGRLLPTGVRN